MPTHKWLLRISPEARKAVSNLPTSSVRMAVFRAIRELLQEENPLIAPDVVKIKLSEGVWRRRQGNYRILFTLNSEPVTNNKHRYKGTFYLLAIRKRDESTYD